MPAGTVAFRVALAGACSGVGLFSIGPGVVVVDTIPVAAVAVIAVAVIAVAGTRAVAATQQFGLFASLLFFLAFFRLGRDGM